MSPGSSGTLGYDDDQEQSSWDGGDSFFEATTQQTGTVVSPVVDCGRWAGLAFRGSVTGNLIICTLGYALDAAFTRGMGSVNLGLDPNITFQPLSFVFRNRGPYVKATLTPPGPSTIYTPSIRCLLTNRPAQFSGESGAGVPLAFAGSIAAGATTTVWPFAYISGTLGLGTFAGSTPTTVDVWVLGGDHAYHRIYSKALAASAFDYAELIMPPSGWFVNLTNTGGATNTTCTVTATAE